MNKELNEFLKTQPSVERFVDEYDFEEGEARGRMCITIDDVLGFKVAELDQLSNLLNEVIAYFVCQATEDVKENISGSRPRNRDGVQDLISTLEEQTENLKFWEEILENIGDLRDAVDELSAQTEWISGLKSASPGMFDHILTLLQKHSKEYNLNPPFQNAVEETIFIMQSME
jgi:hypothetical protein